MEVAKLILTQGTFKSKHTKTHVYANTQKEPKAILNYLQSQPHQAYSSTHWITTATPTMHCWCSFGASGASLGHGKM